MLTDTQRDWLSTWVKENATWSLSETGEIDVTGTVHIKDFPDAWLPVQFNVVRGSFIIQNSQLVSLKGCPRKVWTFDCTTSDKLMSWDYAPEVIHTRFYSFACAAGAKQIHKHIKRIGGEVTIYTGNRPTPVLGLLMIEGITKVNLSDNKLSEILNRYLAKEGVERIHEAQEELISAGFGQWARV